MLKPRILFFCVALSCLSLFSYSPLFPGYSVSFADGCNVDVNSGQRFGSDNLSLGISCQVTSGGSRATSETDNGSGSSGSGCYRADGTVTACWLDDYWWSPTFDMYCKVENYPPEHRYWDGHRDPEGNTIGTFYHCTLTRETIDLNAILWEDTPTVTPPKPGTDPTTLIESSLDTLGLHAPTVGVGAYVYPGYEEWGLSWWVGAPMWLWVDTTDPLQWGTHTLSASAWDLSATADVTPTSVTFDPGDGSDPVVCLDPGTPRPWDPTEPLRDHSPSGCEYTYMTTNELGNVDSRFTVTATVTWTVTWSSTDGQQGQFTTDMVSTDSASIHVGELRVVRVPTPA